ncbi:hypothetical protein [Aurantiacibacter sediminis]|uniref:PEP-CTERM sorting domain-containing protein n=1 Tax=Aurantiacibacter sediminis TaxID=2793064 RepID=A0ABS0N1R5_9SPHN|nr:hypothetical protein [Aurantiacibacter sediminis]MBH5321858.1 hypothetical protein [Aurantiacibacter sediminis]
MTRLKNAFLAASVLGLIAACGSDGSPFPGSGASPSPTSTSTPVAVTFNVDFGVTGEDWTRDIAEYGNRADTNFISGVENLPPNLPNERGLLLAGSNFTDSLTMYAWRKVEGLAPSQDYRVDVTLLMASDVPPGCVGIGGSPGEGVTVKAGASDEMPQAGTILNVDKGDQDVGGSEAVVIGDLAVPGAPTCVGGTYASELIGTTPASSPVVSSNESGELWLIVLSDSGFESRSEWYLLEAEFTLDPV